MQHRGGGSSGRRAQEEAAAAGDRQAAVCGPVGGVVPAVHGMCAVQSVGDRRGEDAGVTEMSSRSTLMGVTCFGSVLLLLFRSIKRIGSSNESRCFQPVTVQQCDNLMQGQSIVHRIFNIYPNYPESQEPFNSDSTAGGSTTPTR